MTSETRIEKFQNWVEIKVNYPTNKENTPKDLSGNFRNMKSFVQVDHLEKITKNRLNRKSRKTAGGRKIFKMVKIKHILMPDYHVKISEKSDHHALQNLSSNTDANFSRTDNNLYRLNLF
jgi:hypothetical protein